MSPGWRESWKMPQLTMRVSFPPFGKVTLMALYFHQWSTRSRTGWGLTSDSITEEFTSPGGSASAHEKVYMRVGGGLLHRMPSMS